MSKREEYVERLKAQLDAWNSDIEKLEGKARVASAETRTKIEEQVVSLKSRRDEAAVKFDALREATEEKWEELKDATEGAWAKLKDRFSNDHGEPPA